MTCLEQFLEHIAVKSGRAARSSPAFLRPLTPDFSVFDDLSSDEGRLSRGQADLREGTATSSSEPLVRRIAAVARGVRAAFARDGRLGGLACGAPPQGEAGTT